MMDMTRHVRILRPHPGIIAFYDGRVDGHCFADTPNWVDDGALSLGIASYALVNGDQALVYDTHVSIPHARLLRATLQAEGVRHITVVLSHCHLDHVAGTEVFADCEIISNCKTLEHLSRDKKAIETGTLSGLPVISPLILPTRVFEDEMHLRIGDLEVHLIEASIHSDDATVVWLPSEHILLAGDTVEDTVTYVGEPESFADHLKDLEKLSALGPQFVLPDHGSPEIIAVGGYGPSLLSATAAYIRWLMRLVEEPELSDMPLEKVIAGQLADGSLSWFAPYGEIHRQNIQRTKDALVSS
jgi:cyclase